MRRCGRWLAVACAAAALLVTAAWTPTDQSSGLSAGLGRVLRDQQLDRLVDTYTGRRIARTPDVDLAVIELGPDGRPVAAANVRMGRRSPFPASVLKLMVGFGVLRLVDRGELDLDDVRDRFDAMITRSDNEATKSLIRLLHRRGEVDDLNRRFRQLGLGNLRLTGTDPATGGRWTGVRMSAVDTARLLLIVSGAPGPLWQAPGGRPVTAGELSPASRAYFYRTLSEQGLNHALSTTNWCGRRYPAPGIPQLTPSRWVARDGTVVVDHRTYGQRVAPCDAAAEVTFAHKTGWTANAGSDAGIVHALPGKPERDYIVVVLSNLGWRYVDAGRPADPPGVYPVPYTERLGALGRQVDELMTARRR